MGEAGVALSGKNNLPQGGKEGGTKNHSKRAYSVSDSLYQEPPTLPCGDAYSDFADKKAETLRDSGTCSRPHRKRWCIPVALKLQ